MAPSTIQRGIERNQQRLANGGSSGTPITQPVEATPAPNPPGAPQQDLPIMVPRRGLFPASLVLASDRSDNSREFRGAGARSATFPFPGGTGVPVTTAAEEASIQSQLWDPKVSYPSGALVAYNGSTYVSNQASQGQTPPTGVSTGTVGAPAIPASDDFWTLTGTGVADNLAGGNSLSPVTQNAVDPNGNINLGSNPGVNPTGSVSPIGSTPFSYSATTTTITIFWSAFQILLLNQNTITVPDGSQLITSLTADTVYTFFPYLDSVTNPALPVINFVESANVSGLQEMVGVTLNGSSGEITTANSLATSFFTSPFTLECWVFLGSNVEGGFIEFNTAHTGSLNGSPNFGPSLYLDGTSTLKFYTNGTNTFSVPVTLITGFWYYIVAQWTSNGSAGAHVYIDGVGYPATGMGTPPAIGGFIRIGRGDSTNNFFLTGTIGRVALYQTALTAAQVENHYNIMLTGGQADYDAQVLADGAVHYWTLSESSGTTAADTGSGTADAGTYTGGFVLDQEFAIGAAVGDPAVAWLSPSIEVTLAQYLQQFNPLGSNNGAGGLQLATTATGTAGGVSGGFPLPGVPGGVSFRKIPMNYYIVSKTTYQQFMRCVMASHYSDLPDGNILLKAAFRHEHARSLFEGHPAVKSLPHVSSGRQIGADIAGHLGHLGAKETHTTFDAVELAAAQNKNLRIR